MKWFRVVGYCHKRQEKLEADGWTFNKDKRHWTISVKDEDALPIKNLEEFELSYIEVKNPITSGFNFNELVEGNIYGHTNASDYLFKKVGSELHSTPKSLASEYYFKVGRDPKVYGSSFFECVSNNVKDPDTAQRLDLFAAAALTGILSNPSNIFPSDAEAAVKIATEMIWRLDRV